MRQIALRALVEATERLELLRGARGVWRAQATEDRREEEITKLRRRVAVLQAYVEDRLDGVPVERGRYVPVVRVVGPGARWVGNYYAPYTITTGVEFFAGSPRVARAKALHVYEISGEAGTLLEDVVRVG